MLRNQHARRTATALLTGALLTLPLGPLSQAASAQCADPRGNSYCQNNGQVTFSPAPGQAQPTVQPQALPAAGTGGTASSPAVQSNAPSAVNPSISLDPPAALAGATVTVSAQGLGPNRSAWVNLSQMQSIGGLNLGAKQLATINTAGDGSLTATVTIPTVPNWTAGTASICLINATAQPVCAPFTLQSAEQALVNTATTPDAIVGHYQCSSATLIGFGGSFCSGGEPILAINSDGTYSYGDEQGGWSFDGSTLGFDGSLGSASVLNRRLTIDTQVDMPDGSGIQAVRYIYIRLNY